MPVEKGRPSEQILGACSNNLVGVVFEKEWIFKYPHHKVLPVSDDWRGILAVLKWFFNHPHCGLYLRH